MYNSFPIEFQVGVASKLGISSSNVENSIILGAKPVVLGIFALGPVAFRNCWSRIAMTQVIWAT